MVLKDTKCRADKVIRYGEFTFFKESFREEDLCIDTNAL